MSRQERFDQFIADVWKFQWNAGLASFGVALPLMVLFLAIDTAFEFQPTAALVIFVATTVTILAVIVAIATTIQRASEKRKTILRRLLFASGIASALSLFLIQYSTSLELVLGTGLPIERLLHLDAIDVTAAEDAAAFDLIFTLWLILSSIFYGALQIGSALTPHR